MADTLCLEDFSKTYTIEKFGIVINNDVIPVGSIGDVYIDSDMLRIRWTCPTEAKEHIEIKNTRISTDDFLYLRDNHFIVDISKVRKPNTKPKFTRGDLVFVYDFPLIVQDSVYDYVKNIWQYCTFTIGEDFSRQPEEFLYNEDDLQKIDEYKDYLCFGDKRYSITLKEQKGDK